MAIGCLVLLLLVASPRLVLFVTWLFTGYLGRAFETTIWPFLGFLFLPWTTLLYAVGANEFVSGNARWILAAVGLILDLSLQGGGLRSSSRRSSA